MPLHPEAEVLAAYAERALTLEEKAGVDRHLLTCAECRVVLADTVAVVAELRAMDAAAEPRAPESAPQPQTLPPPLPFWRRRPLATSLAGLATAAVLILAVVTYSERPAQPASTETALQNLMTALAAQETRPSEGRLAAVTAYARTPAMRGAKPGDAPPEVALAAARVEASVGNDRSQASLRALGIARLATHDFAGAVAALEAATRETPDAGALNDLAVAYLGRAESSASPKDDAERALEAADRALTLDRNSASALFNRALALEALERDATAAWQAVAEREPGSEWAGEAARRPATP